MFYRMCFHLIGFWFKYGEISKIFILQKIHKINQIKPNRIYLKYLDNNLNKIYSCRNVLKPKTILSVFIFELWRNNLNFFFFEILYEYVFFFGSDIRVYFFYSQKMFILFVNSNKILNCRLDTIEFFVLKKKRI